MESLNVVAFSAFDWVLIALTVISVMAAFRRGLIRVLFSLGGLIAGVVIASWTYLRLGAEIARYHQSQLVANVAAFLIIFVVVNLLSLVAGALASKTAAALGLGLLDRVLGAGFGFLRGVAIGVVVLIVLAAFQPNSNWIRDSRLAPYFLAGTHAVSFVVPDSFREQVTAGTTRLIGPPEPQPHASVTIGQNRPHRTRARPTDREK